MHEGFNSTYQVLTAVLTKFVQKVCFAFGKKDQKNTQYLSKKATVTVINVFIFNKLDFQRLLLPINFKSICLRAFFFLCFNLRSVKIPALKLCYWKLKNDLLMNMNKGYVSLLVLLDLSAAFDTVDHEILIHTLQIEFGLGGAVLSWFVSYVTHRSQRVPVEGMVSDVFDLYSGVSQGPCLGPLLFSIYASKIPDAIIHSKYESS